MKNTWNMASALRVLCLALLVSGWALPASALDAGGLVLETQDVAPININTAGADFLAAGLSGVGLKKAQAIVAWRVAHGEFETIEQLMEVKGVGSAILAKNKAVIRLE